eukprot:14919918-Alexandrium_andersonii.AAC.1
MRPGGLENDDDPGSAHGARYGCATGRPWRETGRAYSGHARLQDQGQLPGETARSYTYYKRQARFQDLGQSPAPSGP